SAATGTVNTFGRWEAVNATSIVAWSRPASTFSSSTATVTSTFVEAGLFPSAGWITVWVLVIFPVPVLPSGSLRPTAAPVFASRARRQRPVCRQRPVQQHHRQVVHPVQRLAPGHHRPRYR